MLTEQRYEVILRLLEERKSITINEIRDALDISESTVRRDITALHNAGRLVKVFGGAVAIDRSAFNPKELTVAQKMEVNQEEKRRIARYAATLIEPEDFVYLDAGTTTGYMIDYIDVPTAVFVTNAVEHARRLVTKGIRVLLVGGELKASTEAVVGNQAIRTLLQYHFTRGFFGTNGITRKAGCTTPDASEANVKQTAIGQCSKSCILADYSKFGAISSVTFAPFEGTMILTDQSVEGYGDCKNVIVAGQKTSDSRRNLF
ncbi:MAG: DeoR/GlpR family DNA-binding transcription regulator [Lachnospiraceae bacterium]|nr:DeoR/GlpR family DNA-binding transcription regulator [Lachnospiraceae bacterium]